MIEQLIFSCGLVLNVQENLQKQLGQLQQCQISESYHPTFTNVRQLQLVSQNLSESIQTSMQLLQKVDLSKQMEEVKLKEQSEQFTKQFEDQHGVKFRITKLQYDLSLADYSQIPYKNFGQGYRVADWSDLERILKQLNPYQHEQFTQYLGYSNDSNDFAILYKGVKAYSQSRFYFASFHNHKKPHCFMAHANLNNFQFSLGSWLGSRKILCILDKNGMQNLNNSTQSLQQSQQIQSNQKDYQIQHNSTNHPHTTPISNQLSIHSIQHPQLNSITSQHQYYPNQQLNPIYISTSLTSHHQNNQITPQHSNSFQTSEHSNHQQTPQHPDNPQITEKGDNPSSIVEIDEEYNDNDNEVQQEEDEEESN